MDRRSALTAGSFVSIVALAALASGCSGASDPDRVAGRGDALADCDPADTTCDVDATPTPSCDDGTDPCADVPPCDPNDGTCTPCDPSVPPTPCTDCSPQEAFAIDATCDTSLGWKWNGVGCEQLVGCACQGAACNGLWKTGDACKLAHEGCAGGGDPCADLAATLAKMLPEVQSCSLVDVSPGEACSVVVPALPAGCGVPANAQAPLLLDYEKTWQVYAASCPLPDPPCPNIDGKVGACVQGAAIDSTVGVCAWADGATPADQTD